MQENGAEELCRILNGFFTILVGIVHKFCGDIVKVRRHMSPQYTLQANQFLPHILSNLSPPAVSSYQTFVL